MAKRKTGTRRKPRIKMRPGYAGAMEQVPAEVDDPYEQGKLRVVTRNIRECGLLVMWQRKQIDDAQLKAGEWARSKIEQSRMSSGAVDPSNEPVDRSGHSDPIPDRVIAAAQAVAKAREYVGAVSWPLIQLVCGDGHTITEAAHRRYGLASKTQIEYTGRLLRETLDELAVYLGYASPKRHVPTYCAGQAKTA